MKSDLLEDENTYVDSSTTKPPVQYNQQNQQNPQLNNPLMEVQVESAHVKHLENLIKPWGGWVMLCICIIAFLVGAGLIVLFSLNRHFEFLAIPILFVIGSIFCCCGFFTNPPNTAVVLMLCDKYVGTVKENGFLFINPFYSKRYLSFRSETLNSPIVKVNDKIGNPIKVGCVIIWRVKDCTKALFDVENYRSFIVNQCESAVRTVGCMYSYDHVNEDDVCLRSGHDIVNNTLKIELSRRLEKAGIEVEDARITEISYSTEIANAMLKRQAAEAVVVAREKIVRGAVDIVQQAVMEMETKNICKLEQTDKARMVGNLMVVLCSDSQVNPVVNTGSS